VARPESELAAVAGRGMQEMVAWVAEKYARRTGLPAPLTELERFAMQAKGLPFSLYRTHRSLSMQGSYAAASDIGAHHAAAWLIKVDLLGAFPTFADKARALITYPRVRLGNDNLGLCKLPWVDVFNPESKLRENTDIYINPASQEIYAELYNGMLGTELTWEQIFEQTDRDINLQRVMNTLVFPRSPGDYDWLPDRAIGPTDDDLYLAEKDFNDQEVARFLGKPVEDIVQMGTAEKREILMSRRKEELRQLIDRYYQERGWPAKGIPTPETLNRIGLWDYLTAEAREKIEGVSGL
jgi:aldehyde:ferredoxin oxidoreductase